MYELNTDERLDNFIDKTHEWRMWIQERIEKIEKDIALLWNAMDRIRNRVTTLGG